MVSNRSITLASLLLHESPFPLSPLKQQDWRTVLAHCPLTLACHPQAYSREDYFIPFTVQIYFKALSVSPTNSCTKILSPLRQVCPSCCKACCHMDWPGIKTPKILLVSPGSETGIDLLGLPDSSLINPCKCKDRGKNTYAFDPSISHSRALKSFLIALRLLVATSSLLTRKLGNNQRTVPE